LKGSHGSAGHRATTNACLAEASLLRGDCTGAIERARSVLGIREASYGPDGPPIAEALTLLGRAQAAGGHLGEARSTLDRAHAIQERRLGDRHPATLQTVRALGVLKGAKAR